MVTRVSTQGILSSDLFLIQRQNTQFDLLNFRVATGRQFRELKQYGNQAPQILDLQNELASRTGYNRSISLAEVNLNSYDVTLERLIEVATQLVKASTPLSSDEPNFTTTAEATAASVLVEIEANLNIEIGERFLFAGSRFDTAPVVELTSLPLYTANDIGVANAVETANDIPTYTVDSGGANTAVSYHTQGPNTVDARSYDSAKLTIADNISVSYGITANESAFQKLIDATIRFRSSAQAGLTSAERESFLSEAQTLAQSARDELRQLQSINGLNLARLKQQTDAHNAFISISQIALDDITLADDATSAAELSSLSSQIQASFTVISRRAQLSLVNFL